MANGRWQMADGKWQMANGRFCLMRRRGKGNVRQATLPTGEQRGTSASVTEAVISNNVYLQILITDLPA